MEVHTVLLTPVAALLCNKTANIPDWDTGNARTSKLVSPAVGGHGSSITVFPLLGLQKSHTNTIHLHG